jgi:hypothetical protein
MSLIRIIGTGIAASFLLCSSTVAKAALYDGNKLVSDMKAWEPWESSRSDDITLLTGFGVYLGYVTAVADSSDVEYCIGDGITARQLTSVVAKYLHEHPAEWNKPAFGLVRAALRQAFCKREK